MLSLAVSLCVRVCLPGCAWEEKNDVGQLLKPQIETIETSKYRLDFDYINLAAGGYVYISLSPPVISDFCFLCIAQFYLVFRYLLECAQSSGVVLSHKIRKIDTRPIITHCLLTLSSR